MAEVKAEAEKIEDKKPDTKKIADKKVVAEKIEDKKPETKKIMEKLIREFVSRWKLFLA